MANSLTIEPGQNLQFAETGDQEVTGFLFLNNPTDSRFGYLIDSLPSSKFNVTTEWPIIEPGAVHPIRIEVKIDMLNEKKSLGHRFIVSYARSTAFLGVEEIEIFLKVRLLDRQVVGEYRINPFHCVHSHSRNF